METTNVMVKKRNGKAVVFDLTKIENAINKAFTATETPVTANIITQIALIATNKAMKEQKKEDGKRFEGILDVEIIQDAVIKALYSLNYDEVADAYAKVRKEHATAREIMDAAVSQNVFNYTRELEDADPLAVNSNASQTMTIAGLHQYLSGEDEKRFWQVTYDKCDPRIRKGDQDNDGTHYIHDYTLLTAYCMGWSLGDLIEKGIPSIGGTNASAPAKHLSSLCVQMANFLGILQGESAG